MDRFKYGDRALMEVGILYKGLDKDGEVTSYQVMFSNGVTTIIDNDKLIKKEELVSSEFEVTKEIMDWYENKKYEFSDYTLDEWLEASKQEEKVNSWLFHNKEREEDLRNQLAFSVLIVRGPDFVSIEREKKYALILKATQQILLKDKEEFFFNRFNPDLKDNILFTRQELIEAGFGRAFDYSNSEYEIYEEDRIKLKYKKRT